MPGGENWGSPKWFCFCLPFSLSDAKALPVFTSSHPEQIKISSIFALFDWKHWIRCFLKFFYLKDVLTDILPALQKWLQSPSALGVFPPFLPFLSLPLPCLNTYWKEKEALERDILAVGAGRCCCSWLGAVLDWGVFQSGIVVCSNSSLRYFPRGEILCFPSEFIHHQADHTHQKMWNLASLQDHYKGLKENISPPYISCQTTPDRSAGEVAALPSWSTGLKKCHL